MNKIDLKQLKDYSEFKGDLRGDPFRGTVAYMGGIPSNFELFTYSLAQMQYYNARKIKERIHLEVVRSSSHSYARNILSKHVLGDWVLMLDMDIQFEPDLLIRMLKTFDEYEGGKLNVLTGVYLYKKKPYWPVIYTWNKKLKQYQTVKEWVTADERLNLLEVDGAGAGCLMIRKWVFKYIEQELHEEPFSIRKPFDNPKALLPLGEDLSFFDRCRQLDIQVVCDPTITVNHIYPRPVEVGVEYEPHVIDPERIAKSRT